MGMSISVSEKIRAIRDSEGMGRKAFADKLGISQRTLESIENKGTDPSSSILKAICKGYPAYTFWLTLDTVNPEIGQISPELKETASEYGKTGTDTE
ncbi:helix-turn-helix transcriptional regulator [Neptunomonas antarctica]|uniref:DNA-binding transcriptional regulator, XRE-family HTH domain n=1 Tax=Neptunomonas antarctica TaxID=619304 RepID=A0A1N7J5K2_9GAMM|nr:helix-turn-helix transcriptional regulator [Neptunomonas antarctica]SIS44579.1 DNA-binding transcriptional regulator, XRE-family HTH domain [Neptunomonas antarctica]